MSLRSASGQQQVLSFFLQSEVDRGQLLRQVRSIDDIDIESRHLSRVRPVLCCYPMLEAVVCNGYRLGDPVDLTKAL